LFFLVGRKDNEVRQCVEHIEDFSEELSYVIETVEADAFDDRSKLQSEGTVGGVMKWNPHLVVFDGCLFQQRTKVIFEE
jgi:hypothetical protein